VDLPVKGAYLGSNFVVHDGRLWAISSRPDNPGVRDIVEFVRPGAARDKER
jgi:hypothetical protein